MSALAEIYRAPIFWMILRPLILRNYAMRAQGLLADEWYWADRLALSWGRFA
jgi:hypothetical protein